MKVIKNGSAVWKGGLKTGEGAISTQSGALDKQPYGFGSRFADQKGTNPEELIAAAHAACFTMFLGNVLEQAGHVAEQMDTKAAVTLEINDQGSIDITTSHLTLTAKVPGLDQATFDKLVKEAKEGCPVSKVLKATITLDAKLT